MQGPNIAITLPCATHKQWSGKDTEFTFQGQEQFSDFNDFSEFFWIKMLKLENWGV